MGAATCSSSRNRWRRPNSVVPWRALCVRRGCCRGSGGSSDRRLIFADRASAPFFAASPPSTASTSTCDIADAVLGPVPVAVACRVSAVAAPAVDAPAGAALTDAGSLAFAGPKIADLMLSKMPIVVSSVAVLFRALTCSFVAQGSVGPSLPHIHDADSSLAEGSLPSGVYLSTASGRLRDSLDRSSSRERPVC